MAGRVEISVVVTGLRQYIAQEIARAYGVPEDLLRQQVADPEVIERQRREFQEQEKLLAERQAAQQKARELLTSCLDEGQRMTFEASGFFDVRGQDGKLYRIYDNSVMNVTDIENNTHYCAQLIRKPDTGHIPLYDQLLAQKLCLEMDIEHFLHVAHKGGLGPATPIEEYVGPRFIP